MKKSKSFVIETYTRYFTESEIIETPGSNRVLVDYDDVVTVEEYDNAKGIFPTDKELIYLRFYAGFGLVVEENFEAAITKYKQSRRLSTLRGITDILT